ncbi:malate:quinone oxidoreductase [Ruicaihuangia caeni]
MSATLGAIIKQLEPSWTIQIFETLSEPARESSNAWNNAGTGHSALCELNYTPQLEDGTIETAKAITINEQFQVSRQFWSFLVSEGLLPDPSAFINPVPHMSFVWGEDNVEYLRKRYEALKGHPLFNTMEFSDDPRVIHEWAPLLMPGRAKSQPIAATRVVQGTDVDFGALTRYLLDYLVAGGAAINTEERVTSLKRTREGLWKIRTRHEVGRAPEYYTARFVFVGAGGHALPLLQKSGIPEIKGFAGFPISGQFLRTDNPDIVARHDAKVYGKAAVGAPPMSVPHLDTRVVDGEKSLMFGPYAGFSPKFLKRGSWGDLFSTIRPHNLLPMIQVGLSNFDLVKYLVGELLAGRNKRLAALREYYPDADGDDWYLITAGQRVQVIKKDAEGKGVLQFGTEVIAAQDGSIAGLLGASPGASTAVPIMLQLLERCFPDRADAWQPKIKAMVPSYGKRLSDNKANTTRTLNRTAKALQLA